MQVSNNDILKTILLKELDRMEPETSTFEDDPMKFILSKYQGLKTTLEYLMTPSFEEYVTGIYVVAPKPTTFKIVLHNGQFFFLQFMGKAYEATVLGKKYYLMTIGEKERAMVAISRLLRYGNPLKTKGPEGAEQATRDSEGPAEEAGPTPPAETSNTTAGEEQLTESKILEAILKKNIVTELTITPDYTTKKGPNPYYIINDDIKNDIAKAIKVDPNNIVFKNVINPKGKPVLDRKGNYKFQISIDKNGNIKDTSYYVNASKSEVVGHYGEKSTGSGGGAAQTAVQESSQCLVNAVRYNKGSDISDKDLNQKNFTKATKRIETTSSLEEMVSFIQDNPSWRTSLISTANALAKQFPGNFKFYRGAGVASIIDQAAKKCLQGLIGNINVNKWNPADIWMASQDLDIDSILDTKEIKKLNKWMLDKYKSKQLIGVSLKKCGEDCTLTTYNTKKIKRPEKFEGLGLKDTNFFKSLDVYVKYTDGVIQFRNFSNITSWQGEIKSKTAAGGKIGGGGVSRVLYLAGAESLLPQQGDVLAICQSANEKTASNLYGEYKTISLLGNKMEEDAFKKAFLSAPLSSKTSNYMNIELLKRLSEMSKEERDAFIQGLISYAKSETNISSVFVKAS